MKFHPGIHPESQETLLRDFLQWIGLQNYEVRVVQFTPGTSPRHWPEVEETIDQMIERYVWDGDE